MFRRRSSAVQPSGFTPAQIIGLVLAATLLVLAVPVGVKAAGSLVTIVDSTTTNKARVDGVNGGLRVGGITSKALDKSGILPLGTEVTFTFSSALYSQIRIFAEEPVCGGGGCITLTVDCVEGTTRTCLLVPPTNFDTQGFDQVQPVPGRTVRVSLREDSPSNLPYHIVVYGRTP